MVVLQESGMDLSGPTPIFCDNQGTVFTVHNPYINHRSKHLDIRYYRARQMIRDRMIDVIFCRTHLNLADFFTKSLESSHFFTFKDLIMNTTPEQRDFWKSEGNRKQQEKLAEEIARKKSLGRTIVKSNRQPEPESRSIGSRGSLSIPATGGQGD